MPLVGSERDACPVCGHPSGDCVGHASPPTRILGERLGIQHQQPPSSDATVVVPHDVWEEFTPKRSKRPSRRLKYARGQRITAAQARVAGLLPIEAPAFPPTEAK